MSAFGTRARDQVPLDEIWESGLGDLVVSAILKIYQAKIVPKRIHQLGYLAPNFWISRPAGSGVGRAGHRAFNVLDDYVQMHRFKVPFVGPLLLPAPVVPASFPASAIYSSDPHDFQQPSLAA